MDFTAVFNKLGLDWRMILFNSINFIVFFLILKKFVFGKVGKVVHERQQRIQESMNYADEIDKIMADVHQKADNIIAEANTKANSIVNESEKTAEQIAAEIRIKAGEDAAKLQEKAREDIQKERENMFDQLKKQTADVALLATEKIIKEELDKEKDKAIINEYLDQLEVSKE